MENKEVKGLVSSVSGPREFNGKMQIGFLLKDNPTWYNVPGEEMALNELKDAVLQKGTEIGFKYTAQTKKLGDINLLNLPEKGENGNWSDEMTNFKDLLDAAHTKFGERFDIRTELVRDGEGKILLNFAQKQAVFKATVRVWSENDLNAVQIFTGHGDATESNITNKIIQPHFIRMAETRAISRALRWATNNAAVAVEETDEGEEGGEDQDGDEQDQSAP